MNPIKLFRFTLPDINPSEGERAVLYLYSRRSDEAYLRQQFKYQDPGDMPDDLYQKCCKEGKLEEITSIDQIPLPSKPKKGFFANGERDWIPYTSEEEDTIEFDLTVQEFLSQ